MFLVSADVVGFEIWREHGVDTLRSTKHLREPLGVGDVGDDGLGTGFGEGLQTIGVPPEYAHSLAASEKSPGCDVSGVAGGSGYDVHDVPPFQDSMHEHARVPHKEELLSMGAST